MSFYIRHNKPKAGKTTLRALLDDMVLYKSQIVLKRSPLYLRSITDILEPFVVSTTCQPHEVTPEMIQRCIAGYTTKRGKPGSPVTQKNIWASLHMLFEWGLKKGNVASNPVAEVENIWRDSGGRPKILTIEADGQTTGRRGYGYRLPRLRNPGALLRGSR